MSFDDAIVTATRDERFMATVYAMNTLLIHKGVYTKDEFETLFVEWVRKDQQKKSGNTSAIAEAPLAVGS